ncbi:5-(carboxyamino)imidazole ribonucleotide synthase [Adhaeretor mobilis]|uniref:N5-carboxyaminoimidazole ribonucleotide synthase n=1 Tax=Adhaeretor mobilis TaxID=1930276 RepID=A0A517MRB6_9BACT|nr:5-(carboxyamino)imidazole ribonucleotide synthase [Adhaeretor mobilis]QDS97409.1 N5-carboxyaminoimidazole ribonucleotide synthase [Adhaeretor mobilis]
MPIKRIKHNKSATLHCLSSATQGVTKSNERAGAMSEESQAILPGATIGVFGSGQLGRMLAHTATRMGYRVRVFAPESRLLKEPSPAGGVAQWQTVAEYDDLDAVTEFARSVDVVTLEFENIPSATVETAAIHALVRPSAQVLHTTQDRLREKTFLQEAGIGCTPFAAITTDEELQAAVESVGLPGIIKTSAWGYDGKGQTLVRTLDELSAAWEAMDRQSAILEGLVDFQCEFSMLVARSPSGEVKTCGPLANDHANHILDVTTLSAKPTSGPLAGLSEKAATVARTVAERLDAIGLLCVEFFLTKSGGILVNEIAPRPHNSGHLTIEACQCSQFEQQVRAVCNVPLGSFNLIGPSAAMANLMGDLWFENGMLREPNWSAVLASPQLRLHLYGKAEPRPGRKMGHLTALADSPEEAERLVREARAALGS